MTKVDAFTIKQTIAEYHSGGAREPIKVPGQIEFPQLTFYVPEADAQPFMDRFTKRAVKGEANTSDHKGTGMIETYDNGGSTLFTVKFSGADIVSVLPEKSDASSEELKLVKIELYTEKMEFKYER